MRTKPIRRYGARLWLAPLACWLFACAATPAKGEAWAEVRSDHFTVYSDAGEGPARRITHQFEKFHAVIRSLLPSLEADPGMPTIVLAARDGKTLGSLLPQFADGRDQARPGGFFVGGEGKNYIALRLDTSEVPIAIPPGIGDEGYVAYLHRINEHYRYHAVYHEYVHLLMRLNYPPLPVWIDEGLAECFGHTVISDRSSVVGHPSPIQLGILRNERRIPLDELFAVDRRSPYYREEARAAVFYAQSWALTHMLFLGDERAHAPRLLQYLERLRDGVAGQAAAAEAFGDLEDLGRRLDAYVGHAAFYAFEVKTPPVRPPEEYRFRRVPPAEMRAVQGDFFVAMRLWPEAKALLDSVLEQDPNNAEALTSMGLYHAGQNRREEAAGFFKAAALAGSTSCIPHYHAGIAAMQAGEYALAEEGLRRAVALNGRFAPAYAALAGIMAMKEETAASALDLALEAVELEPGVGSHQLVLAHALMRLRKTDAAIRYGERAAAAAVSDRDREEAARFLAMARTYRDHFAPDGPGWPDGPGRQDGTGPGETSEQDAARRHRREDREKAFEEAEREEQRILKERSEAYEQRDRIERDYLREVDRARGRDLATLEGTVSEVRCFDPAGMELIVEAGGGSHLLHIANYYRVRFAAKDHAPDGELKPCRDLPGLRVTVEYVATPGAAYSGEVQSLGIYRAPHKTGP